jgi:hypothetical protein
VESRRTYLKIRRQNQMDNELHGYIDWICKAEEAILCEEKTTELERRHIMESMKFIFININIINIKAKQIFD